MGAIAFANALHINKSITNLNLASNSINDHGAQRLAASFGSNHVLADIDLSQNGIMDGTCFVVSQVRGI